MKITKKVLLILLSLALVLGAVAVGAMSVSAQTSCSQAFDVPYGELPFGTEKYYKVVAASAADGAITDVYIKAIKEMSELRIYESSDLQSLINGTVTVVSVNLTGSYTYNSGIETWTISIAGTGNYSSIDSLTPVLELPDNSYLEIGGVSAITGGNIRQFSGTGWSIEGTENGITLNLDDLDLTCDDNCINAFYLDLTITGSAKLTSTEANCSAIDSSRGSLTLNGNFVLRAQSETGSALECANGNLTVDGGSLDVINTADNAAISVSGTMTVNGGHIYAESSSDEAIYANKTLTVNGGSVYAKTENYVRAIYGGGIILNNNESFALGDKRAKEVLIKKSGELAGKGTEDFPYMICDYADLKLFASTVNGTDGQTQNSGACAKLMKDIECKYNPDDEEYATDWTPIGDGSGSSSRKIKYTGTFDGGGHSITGLTTPEDYGDYAGLFGFVGEGGKVQNIGLEDGKIKGANSVGGVAGVNSGKVTNCYNTGTVSGNYAGGVVGLNYGTATNCYNTGSVSGTEKNVGGVAGFNYGTVTNCYNTGSVTATGDNTHVGGVAGFISNNAEVKNCYNTGDVSGTGNIVGGVVGFISYDAEVTNCYYDSEKCALEKAFGNADNTDIVKGLTTAQMTGDGALSDSNMKFVYSTPEENPWLTKADEVGDDGAYYWFYPHLKGFNFNDESAQMTADEIKAADWPAKAEVTVTLSEYSFEYDGTPLMPTVTSVISGKTLEPNIDYTVSYYHAAGNVVYSPVNAGNYKAVVTFTDAGYAKGHTPIEKEFKITAKSITDDMIRLSQETAEYTGEEITPEVEVKDGATTLAMYTDYTVSYGDINVVASDYTITVTGKGNYTGSVEKMFTITPKSITEDMITLSPDTAEYTGEAITPEVTVKDGDKTLSLVDYTVSYGVNNVDASDYTITVTGIGNYTGSVEKTFTINPKSITDDMITLPPDTAEYTGGDITPMEIVKDGEKTLEKGTDYTVEYSDNVNASENAKVIVKGIGNYTGSVEKTFTITPASVTLTAGSAEETYDGTEKTVSGFTSSVSGLTFDGVSASGNGTLAGSYDVTFSGVTVNETKDTSGNYAVTQTVNGTLTINPVTDEVTVTITGNSDTADYDGEEKSVSGYDVSVSNPLYTESDFTFSGTAEAKRTEPGTENMGLDESQFSNNSSDFDNVKFVIAEDGKLTVNPVITFVNEDGTELQSGAVAYGKTPEYKGETPVKEENDGYAYEFAAWTPEITEATENATYTATYTQTANVYTATFIADGETVDTVTFTVEDSSITEPAVPEKEGNTGEWEKYTLGTEDITVNAVYTVNEYTVTYVVDGNETAVTYKYGAAVEKPADPVKDGFDFIGWDEEIPEKMPAENLTITALFEAIPEPVEPTPTEPTPTDTEPAHEHDYKGEVTTEPTCTEDGVMTYTCECGESYTKAIPKTGHKPGEWTVVTPATTEAAGKEVRKCTVCGEVLAEREIAKLEPQETDAGIVSVNLEKTNAYGVANAFGVDPEKLPAGSTVTWYVNGEKAGEGNGFRVDNPTENYTIKAVVTNRNGKVIGETEETTVKVNNGFFARLYYWLCKLIQKVIDLFNK